MMSIAKNYESHYVTVQAFSKKRSHGTWWQEGSLLFPNWDIKTKRPEPVKLDLPLF